MKLYIQGHFSRTALGDLDTYLNNTSGKTIDPKLTEIVADLPPGNIDDFLSRGAQSYIIIDGKLYAMGLFADGGDIEGFSGLALEPLLLNKGTALESGWTSLHEPNEQVFSVTEPARTSGQGFYAINSGRLYYWGPTGGYPGINLSERPSNVVQLEQGTSNENNWAMVSSGLDYSIGLREGKLYSWGSNSDGVTGQGTFSGSTPLPTQIGNRDDWIMVSCGRYHALAINDSGELYGWGSNGAGKNGTGTTTSTPLRVGSNSDWELCSAGDSESTGIRNDGSAYAWGLNTATGLGRTPNDPNVTEPTKITTLSGERIVDIQNSASNWNHTVALGESGKIFVWGDLDQLYIRDNLNALPNNSLYIYHPGQPYTGVIIEPITPDAFENIEWSKIKVSYYTFMGLGTPIETTPDVTPTPTPSADNLSGVNNIFIEWT